MTKRVPIAVAAVLALAAPAAAQPRVDALGDPLPPGAVTRLGTLRMQHEDARDITAAVFSPDAGVVYFAADPSPVVRACDAATGKERLRLVLPTEEKPPHITLAVSPDGKLLAAASKAGVHLWLTATGKAAGSLDSPGGTLIAVAFQDGGKTLVGADYTGAVVWWDLVKGREIGRWLPWKGEVSEDGLKLAQGFTQAVFSADGQTLAVERIVEPNAWTTTVAVFDLAARKERWRLICDRQPRLAFAPNGTRLALRARPAVIEVRDVATGAQLAAHRCLRASGWPDRVELLAFTADGASVAFTGEDAHLTLWSLDNTFAVRTLQVRGSTAWRVQHLAFATDQRSVLLAVGNRIHLADVATGAPLCPRFGHRATPSVAFSADGRRLRTWDHSGGRDPELVWDVGTWQEMAAPARPKLPDRLVALSKDATLAIVNVGDRWDVVEYPGGKRLATLKPPDSGLFLELGEFSPRGTLVIATAMVLPRAEAMPAVAFYEAGTGKLRYHFAKSMADCSWSFSCDDTLVARYQQDGTVHVLDSTTGKLLRVVGKQLPVNGSSIRHEVAFAPGGQALALWDHRHGRVTLWSLATGKALWELPQEDSYSWVHLAWSPDGRTLAVAGAHDHNAVQLVEAATGSVRRIFRGHVRPVCSLAWSPDGRLLASGSQDTTVLVWDVLSGDN
jgi:WD40 repeat protein